MIAVDIWQWCFLTAFLVLSLLDGSSRNYLEEAEVDGNPAVADRWSYFSARHLGRGPLHRLHQARRIPRTFDLLCDLTLGGPGYLDETLDLYPYYRG